MWCKALAEYNKRFEGLGTTYTSTVYIDFNQVSTLEHYYSYDLLSQVTCALLLPPYNIPMPRIRGFFDSLASMWSIINVLKFRNRLSSPTESEIGYVQQFSTDLLKNIIDHKISLTVINDFTDDFNAMSFIAGGKAVSDDVILYYYQKDDSITYYAPGLYYMLFPYLILFLRYCTVYENIFHVENVSSEVPVSVPEFSRFETRTLMFLISMMKYGSKTMQYHFMMNLPDETVTTIFDYCQNNKMFDAYMYYVVKYGTSYDGVDYGDLNVFIESINTFVQEHFDTLTTIGDISSQYPQWEEYCERTGKKPDLSKGFYGVYDEDPPYYMLARMMGVFPGALDDFSRLEKFSRDNFFTENANAISIVTVAEIKKHVGNDYTAEEVFDMLELVAETRPNDFEECKSHCQLVVENYRTLDRDTIKVLLCDTLP